MLSSQRHLFEIPSDVAFLNCAFLGPLPQSVRKAGEQGIGSKCAPWTLSSTSFFDHTEALRKAYGGLLRTTSENIAITPSASYGLAVAAQNLPLAKGQRILLLKDQFPSNVYAWQHIAARKGLTVSFVARGEQESWSDALLRDLKDDVGLIAVPHCHWVDGGLVDLTRVAAAAKSAGASLVLDVTQSLGVLDLDAETLAPDFVVGAGYKWLLGPYRQAFLYADPKYHGGEPVEHNWITRAGSENFAQLVNYQSTFQSGARRFDVGERSDFITVPMMEAALTQVAQWTVPAICDRIAHLNRTIASEAQAAGYQPTPDGIRAPHYLTLEAPGKDSSVLKNALAQAHVHVSVRGSRLRISPHVYNDDDDIDRLVTALKAA